MAYQPSEQDISFAVPWSQLTPPEEVRDKGEAKSTCSGRFFYILVIFFETFSQIDP